MNLDEKEKNSVRNFAKTLKGRNFVNFMHDVMDQDIEDEDDGSGNGRTHEQLIEDVIAWVVNRVESEHEALSSVLVCMYHYSQGERARASISDLLLDRLRVKRVRRVW